MVYQLELLPQPPEHRRASNPWPQWPLILRTSAAHEEGGIRDYNVMTKSLSGRNGRVEQLNAVRVEWGPPDETGRPVMQEVEDSEFSIGVDLVLLAMGFVHPEHPGIVTDLGVDLDGRGNIATNADRMSSVPGVFAAGDSVRGASLVVWAIARAARRRTASTSTSWARAACPSVRV